MIQVNTVPEYIREGAAKRMIQSIDRQKNAAELIAKNERPMDAEKNSSRKIAYIKRQVGVNTTVAKAIANYADPKTLPISEGKRSKAESLQGPTVDFVSICFLDLARAASRCVARIIFADGSPEGTGFMISPTLFITNHHVIPNKAAASNFRLEFNYETDYRLNLLPTTHYSLNPDKFFLNVAADELDFTLVAIGERTDGPLEIEKIGWLPLIDSDDKHMTTMFVNCIQHPGGDPKRLVVRENRILARTDTTLLYGSDTLPGSSGSPVFNDDWEVIALHHWGEPYRALVDNQADLPEIGNEGIRISAIVRQMHNADNLTATQKTLLNEALTYSFRTPSLITDKNNEQPQKKTPENNGSVENHKPQHMNNLIIPSTNGVVSFSVPLTISVQIGDMSTAQVAHVQNNGTITDAAEAVRKFKPDPDYSNRKGYNATYIGRNIPLPKLTARQKAQAAKNKNAKPGENKYELKYQHFSVVMNGSRRIAFYTACNIDGASVIKINRDTGAVTRGPESFQQESAEAREKWFNDNRVDPDEVSEDGLYDNNPKMKIFQRGHLVKRTDPSWGNETKAFKGQSDTFHFTNCAPQHHLFNPVTSCWAGVENWITNTSDDENIRISVFSGPVFEDDDPQIGYLKIPKMFWKVFAWLENGSIRAMAILADQSDLIVHAGEALGRESFDTMPDKLPDEYHVSIKEIERLTELDFGELVNVDVFNGSESLGARRRITDFSELLPERDDV